MRVLFPVAAAAQPGAGAAQGAPAGWSEPASPSGGRGAVLIVDDEHVVLRSCAAALESMGFVVLTAGDGEQAVEVVRRHGASIRAVVLDLTLPGMDGAAALEQILRLQPAVKVILTSGHEEAEANRSVAKEQLAGFIRKPFRLEALGTMLERVLGPTP